MVIIFIFIWLNMAMASFIGIYNGPGAEDITDYRAAYSNILSDSYTYRYVNASEIIKTDVLKDCALFVMPGGADLPYCEALNGAGNKKIKDFIERGGRYFGTCAGAYYGAAYVLYDEKNQVGQSIKGPRELEFFPGIARGPLFKSVPSSKLYDYPVAVSICLNKGTGANYEISDICCQAYYYGGPFFEQTSVNKTIEFFADYRIDESTEKDLFIHPEKAFHKNNKVKSLPAIVFVKKGKGTVVLSGVHLENALFDAKNQDAKINRQKLLKLIFEKLGLETK